MLYSCGVQVPSPAPKKESPVIVEIAGFFFIYQCFPGFCLHGETWRNVAEYGGKNMSKIMSQNREQNGPNREQKSSAPVNSRALRLFLFVSAPGQDQKPDKIN